ncbi:MAG: multi-sensor hybrid histidine kinase [Pedosphaera sp.]|nr:multi-sensor hybrid histidine kinase [Pedosphaera sp.]
MKRMLTSVSQHLARLRLAYVVLALSLIPTAVVYYRVKANVEARDRARFERLVEEGRAAIEQRVPHYVDEMFGIRGLFAANSSVSSEQWNQYVASIEAQRLYPGICTLGYLERANAEDKGAFTKRSRPRGESARRVDPAGDRPVSFPVVYVNHFVTGLKGAPGPDHFADPERRPILEGARDTGQAMATGKVTLLTENGTNQPATGFAIYLPIYRNGSPVTNMEERQTALQGFVFANFESSRLLKEILSGPLNGLADCAVFDGVEMTRDGLLSVNLNTPVRAKNDPPRLTQKITLPILNRTWTLYFSSLPAFDAESQRNLPLIALICWLTLSFLLFGLTCAEVNARARSESITAALRKSETALAAEKERLAVTLYSIGDGVITTDTNGCVLSINQVAEQLTGWPLQEALGKPLDALLRIFNEATREPYPNPLHTALRTGVICSLENPALLIARDGVERIIADSAAPIRGRDGGIIGAVVVFRDVTAKQKSEAELLKESKLESVGLLAGGIAHDFNNVLQGILGNLSLARMNAGSAEKMLERLAAVEKSAFRAKDLTQQLVMFARGGAPIRKRVQIINNIRDATLSALNDTNVHCEFFLPDDLWPVEVDEGQFRQVINNIILNAMQAMPDGGKIEVRAENVEFTLGFLPPLGAGKYVKILIRDFGTGIRPEHMPRIFDPYFTTRKHARGLGLASAYSVVRKHDGQISVETQVGKGSTFQIYLPASIKTVEVLPESDQKRFFGQGRVLVMDDEADILMLVREMLDLMGYEVEVARDGAEALQRYVAAKRADKPFAAVIMDLTIPEGMGGKEAIRRLKELDPQVKAIVSSGYSYDPVMANFREYGFSGVIPKPYVMDDLGRVLGEVIGKQVSAPVATTPI